MKPGADRGELCYPFIYETSWLCDYEVVTDELCGHIGAVLASLSETTAEAMADIARDLERLQPMAFHLNGSLRGRLAVSEEEIQWLHGRLDAYRNEVRDHVSGFVLPRGLPPVPQLHLARSAAKKAIRFLVRIEQEGREIPMEVPRTCNLMCNFFFTLTQVINRRRGSAEVPFVSRSYG